MKKNDNSRITWFLLFSSIAFGLLAYRLVVLSYVRHPFYQRTAQAQSDQVVNVLARGTIYFTDKDGLNSIAATNKKFALPSIVSSKLEKSKYEEISRSISNITGIPVEDVGKVVRSGSDFIRTLSKRLDTDQVAKIKDLKTKGIDVSYQMDRFYPNNTLGADILGFLGYDGYSRIGQYGIEAFYNTQLFGVKEKKENSGVLAGLSNFLPWSSKGDKRNEINHPQDIILTIDKNIQAYAEDKLEEVTKRWSAAGGTIIIQDPKTGKILAMTDHPTFNPNEYASTKLPELFLNSGVQQIFEPGSSFKPITMAAGLDLGKVTPGTTYEDTGVVQIDGHAIRNFDEKAHGIQTMSQVLERSLNTGTIHVENLVGNDNFLNYVINFGFGQRTGIDLPGEVSGDVTNLYSGRKINYLTSSFGQGIAVTPLQLVTAYSAIANGGKLMKPYIVDKIVSEGGTETATVPEVAGIPIKEKTAATLRSMLVSVVDNGFDKARIKGYDIAGKTGTAQIPKNTGGYLEDQFIHSFVGFAPATDSKFVILIKMDKPQGITFAADSLSPIFRDIAAFLINYYSIPPTR